MSDFIAPSTSRVAVGLIVPIPTFPLNAASSTLVKLSPEKDTFPEAEFRVISPEELEIVEEAPAISSLAVGVLVPIPTFPVL